MKKLLIKTILVSIVVLLLPFLLTLVFSRQDNTAAGSIKAEVFEIYYEAGGMETGLSFDEYLLGVIAANMPASYQMEALKAQAIIARTYALYNISVLSQENPGQTRFSASELGLPYIGLDDLKKLWNSENYTYYFSKIENAVYATDNEVLVYRNDLILPVFFDTGSGFTRNASEAWGVNIPYLTSVASKQDVTSTNYLSIEEYAVKDLIDLLGKYYSNLKLSEDNFFEEVSITSRDSAGYVLKINLGSLTLSGEEFAKVLGLSSNHFYIEEYGDHVRVVCNGDGHGVGLSQYGANAMAEEGSSYKDILEYYYTGVTFARLSY
ncbi:MAG TPA: stage II sporulation protein D [Clostridiales bacterium]|nr:stage II sporulation protein D [Clostridiales bacterium]